MARAEAYLHAKFYLDASNRLATRHQRYRQDRQADRTDNGSDSIGRTVLQTVSKNRHLGTIAQVCRTISSQLRHASTIEKRLRSVREFAAPQQISTGFASCLRYCSDVVHRRPTELWTMFCRILGWYTSLYTFSGALAPWRNFTRCKIHFTPKSCVLQYWQRYCTALRQRPSAKLFRVVQGM